MIKKDTLSMNKNSDYYCKRDKTFSERLFMYVEYRESLKVARNLKSIGHEYNKVGIQS